MIPSVSYPVQHAVNVANTAPVPSQSIEVTNAILEEPYGEKETSAAGPSTSLLSAVTLKPSSDADMNVSFHGGERTSEKRKKQNREAAATHRKKRKVEEDTLLATETCLMEKNSELRKRTQELKEEIRREQRLLELLQNIDYITPEDAPQISLDLNQCMSQAEIVRLKKDIKRHLPM